MNKYDMHKSKELRKIAAKVIRENEELHFIRDYKIKVTYLFSAQEKKKAGKTILGECVKVPDTMQWCCPYDFYIVIYEQNCAGLNVKQMEILMLHELKHIGVKEDSVEQEYYIVPHDYEEFSQIIEKYGWKWAE